MNEKGCGKAAESAQDIRRAALRKQRRGDAPLELFHLFGGEDDARLLVWSFYELERGCVCCAEEEALGS